MSSNSTDPNAKNGTKVENKEIDLSQRITANLDGLFLGMNPGTTKDEHTGKYVYNPKSSGNIFLGAGKGKLTMSYSQFALLIKTGIQNKDFIRAHVKFEQERRDQSRKQLDKAADF
ncbi:MAG: hypothetical protein WED05_10085 [Candidatus Atabeyarchaeum deiterrae]